MLLSERGQSEKATYSMIPTSQYITFWKRQNYGDSKKIGVCLGWKEGRNEQMEHRGFSGQCNETIMMDTCHYTFLQTHSMYTTKSEP